jgi:UDP-N-acetylglucosamine diphosphorylase/glucosamine-1-phosphate N-acetyltransferase
MDICIFEDEKYKNLNPLALSRPVFELRTGTCTIRQKLVALLKPDRTFLICREYLRTVIEEDIPAISFDIPAEKLLFINGRVIPDETFMKSITTSEEKLFYAGETLVAAQVNDGKAFAAQLKSGHYASFPRESIEAETIEYPWDLVELSGSLIEREFHLFGSRPVSKTEAHLLDREKIFIGEGVSILPGTVIDATGGPVIIDNETKVMANCYLAGPLYIGTGCLIKAGARLYGAVSMGSTCKIGGEITESIFQGYSNKQHDGFIGHSYIGAWVNIGADTNNSDLKNNYKDVTVYLNNEPVETGLTFVGTFMGDHSKTAINTVINTGTVIGFSVNIFGEGFPPHFIPSFSWGGKRKFITYKLEDAVDSARRVMKRRNVELSDAYQAMMKTVFEQTTQMRHHGI